MAKQEVAIESERSAVDAARARVKARPYLRAADLFDAAFPQTAATVDALAQPHIVLDGYGRILGISPEVAENLGFEVRKLVGRRLIYRVLGSERGKLLQALLTLRTTRVFERVTIRFHRKNAPDVDILLEQVAHIDGPRGTVVVVCAPRFADDGCVTSSRVGEASRAASST